MSRNGLPSELERLCALAPSNRTSIRSFFVLITGFAIYSISKLLETGKLSGNAIGSYSLQWVLLLTIVLALAVSGLIILVLLYSKIYPGLASHVSNLLRHLTRFGYLNLLGFMLPWVAYVLLILWRYEKQFTTYSPRAWLFLVAAFFGAVFIMAIWKKMPFFWALLAAAIIYGAGIKTLGYFPEITAYPFSLSWSEASRYYYASLPYASQLYGFSIPLTPMHPSRYLLQGLPFLILEPTLWLHRFWQVFLWLALSLASGVALAQRFRFPFLFNLLFSVWSFLFVLQGPVYYHLHICVILVLLGFDRTRFWKTMLFVCLSSAWAGISRVNWIPVPALLAAVLYFLEQPVYEQNSVRTYRSWLRYMIPPLAWGTAGGLVALATQAGYILVSRYEDTKAFGSSFTSDLLWQRLMPSPTYPMGVLPTILLVSIPAVVLIVGNWFVGRKDWHWLRIVGLSAVTLILFITGLIVSTKIGGGSNIHNLDSFIVAILVMSSYSLFGVPSFETNKTTPRVWRPWWLVFVLISLPIFWNLDIGDPFIKRNFKQADFDLAKLAGIVEKYTPQGEVLFITQRQLLTFNLIPGIRMVPEYELLTLSEMAISNNHVYLEQFYNDLRRHRFALIIADRQSVSIKDPLLDAFAEENNAWAKTIAVNLMKYYQSEIFFDTQGIDALVPRR